MAKFIIEQKHLINGHNYEVNADSSVDAMLHIYSCSYGVSQVNPDFAEYLCHEDGEGNIVGFIITDIHGFNAYDIKLPSSIKIKYYIKDGDRQHCVMQTENIAIDTSYLSYLFDEEKRHKKALVKFEHTDYKKGSMTLIYYVYEIASVNTKVGMFQGSFTV